MKLQILSLAVSLALLAVGQAATLPGRWEKVDSLAPDTGILIVLRSGDRMEGRYRGSDSETLEVETIAGSDLRLPKASVDRIVSAETDDRLVDGTVIGAAVGFGVGFLSLAAYNARKTASGPIWDGEALAHYASAGILGAAVGALTGALADKAKKSREELYRSR